MDQGERFDAVFGEHFAQVLTYALRRVSSGHEADDAVAAMATTDSWPTLQPSSSIRNSHIDVIERFGREIAHGHLDRSFDGAMSMNPAGKSYGLGPAYALALGCDSATKREIPQPPTRRSPGGSGG